MKISSEVKVGASAIIIILLFVWLFNFLRGQNILNKTDHYHVIYSNVAGLEESSPVEINGLKAGIVTGIRLINDGLGNIEVVIGIDNDYKIPDNSIAEITTATLIAGMKIDLQLGDSEDMLRSGDTLAGRVAISIIDKVEGQLEPISDGASRVIVKIDTLVSRLNMILTPGFTESLKQTNSNVNLSSAELKKILEENRNSLRELIESLNQTASLFAENRSSLDSTIKNLNNVSSKIAGSQIDSTLTYLSESLKTTASLLDKINSGEGSAGKLVNDDSLYVNLSESLEALDLLLTDLKENPGRYVSFSLFGKKEK